MSVFVYGLTYSDVTPHLPFNTDNLDASSDPISTGDITAFIEDGAGKINGVVKKANLSPSSLTDDAKGNAQSYIIWYAVRECLSTLGHAGPNYDKANERVKEAEKWFSNDFSVLGVSNYSRVVSNIKTGTNKTPYKFVGADKNVF